MPHYVPPMDRSQIPEGCYAEWDEEAGVWTFPKLDAQTYNNGKPVPKPFMSPILIPEDPPAE